MDRCLSFKSIIGSAPPWIYIAQYSRERSYVGILKVVKGVVTDQTNRFSEHESMFVCFDRCRS